MAVSLAQKFPRVAYVATACALDKEMEHRIEKHKQTRPKSWLTIEEPIHIAQALQDLKTKVEVAILDCLTLYLSNLIGKEASYPYDNCKDRPNRNDYYDCDNSDDYNYHNDYNDHNACDACDACDAYNDLEKKINFKIEELLNCIKELDYTLIIIGNELGSGLVPENALARLFRDVNGWINQKMAAQLKRCIKPRSAWA